MQATILLYCTVKPHPSVPTRVQVKSESLLSTDSTSQPAFLSRRSYIIAIYLYPEIERDAHRQQQKCQVTFYSCDHNHVEIKVEKQKKKRPGKRPPNPHTRPPKMSHLQILLYPRYRTLHTIYLRACVIRIPPMYSVHPPMYSVHICIRCALRSMLVRRFPHH